MSLQVFASILLFFMSVPMFVIATGLPPGSLTTKVLYCVAALFSAPALVGLWVWAVLGG